MIYQLDIFFDENGLKSEVILRPILSPSKDEGRQAQAPE